MNGDGENTSDSELRLCDTCVKAAFDCPHMGPLRTPRFLCSPPCPKWQGEILGENPMNTDGENTADSAGAPSKTTTGGAFWKIPQEAIHGVCEASPNMPDGGSAPFDPAEFSWKVKHEYPENPHEQIPPKVQAAITLLASGVLMGDYVERKEHLLYDAILDTVLEYYGLTEAPPCES